GLGRGVAIAASLCAAWAATDAAAQSIPLRGVWERVGSAERSDQPSIIELGGGTIKADQMSCRLEHVRAIHDRRWYIDALCDEGGRSDLLQLDLVLLDDGRLLVARRILGTADVYVRRDQRTMATERAS